MEYVTEEIVSYYNDNITICVKRNQIVDTETYHGLYELFDERGELNGKGHLYLNELVGLWYFKDIYNKIEYIYYI